MDEGIPAEAMGDFGEYTRLVYVRVGDVDVLSYTDMYRMRVFEDDNEFPATGAGSRNGGEGVEANATTQTARCNNQREDYGRSGVRWRRH